MSPQPCWLYRCDHWDCQEAVQRPRWLLCHHVMRQRSLGGSRFDRPVAPQRHHRSSPGALRFVSVPLPSRWEWGPSARRHFLHAQTLEQLVDILSQRQRLELEIIFRPSTSPRLLHYDHWYDNLTAEEKGVAVAEMTECCSCERTKVTTSHEQRNLRSLLC